LVLAFSFNEVIEKKRKKVSVVAHEMVCGSRFFDLIRNVLPRVLTARDFVRPKVKRTLQYSTQYASKEYSEPGSGGYGKWVVEDLFKIHAFYGNTRR